MFTIVKSQMSASDSYHYFMEKDREDELDIGGDRVNQVRGQLSKLLKSDVDNKALYGRTIYEDDFEQLHGGFDPQSKVPLSRFQLQKFEKGIKYKHTPGWDMSWAPDKSVSAVWALGDKKLRDTLAAAHAQSVDRAMEYVETKLAYTRTGAGKDDREKLSGLMWTRFDHVTSRELDPQLHSHNFLFNLGLRKNGQIAALDTRMIFRNQHLIDGVYMAEFAKRLEKIGFDLDHNDHGGFRIKGVPRSVTEGFSKRHFQVKEAISRFGYSSPKGFAQAATLSRAGKKHVPFETLFRAWHEQGVSLRFQTEDVQRLLKTQQHQFKATSISNQISQRLNKSGADHSFKAFSRQPLDIETLKQNPLSDRGKARLGRSMKAGIAKDIQKSSKVLQKGAKVLTAVALPSPASKLLSQATKLLRQKNKAMAAQRRSAGAPQRPTLTRKTGRDR